MYMHVSHIPMLQLELPAVGMRHPINLIDSNQGMHPAIKETAAWAATTASSEAFLTAIQSLPPVGIVLPDCCVWRQDTMP